jgi:hypothetical protein
MGKLERLAISAVLQPNAPNVMADGVRNTGSRSSKGWPRELDVQTDLLSLQREQVSLPVAQMPRWNAAPDFPSRNLGAKKRERP